MAQSLIQMDATPTGMRLNEWVAMEEGFFAAEGLDVRVNWDVLNTQQASLGTPEDTDYPNMEKSLLGQFLPKSEMTTACAWGTVCMAGTGFGKMVAGVHGIAPCGVYVRAESKIQTPEDLKDVPIAVGLRAGSHFSLLSHLEKHIRFENINAVNHGGFGARFQVLVDGTVEASSLLPPQNYMAEQLGFRKIIGGEFPTGWFINESSDPDKVERYFRAIDRAEAALNEDLARHLPLWKHSNPPEFTDYKWDYSTFGRGERFVREPITEEAFDGLLDDAHRWGLDNHMTERSYEKLMAPAR